MDAPFPNRPTDPWELGMSVTCRGEASARGGHHAPSTRVGEPAGLSLRSLVLQLRLFSVSGRHEDLVRL